MPHSAIRTEAGAIIGHKAVRKRYEDGDIANKVTVTVFLIICTLVSFNFQRIVHVYIAKIDHSNNLERSLANPTSICVSLKHISHAMNESTHLVSLGGLFEVDNVPDGVEVLLQRY